MRCWFPSGLIILCLVPSLQAEAPKAAEPKTCHVPYRLTATKHILVRAKINGKGPYNFIMDTGAPTLFVNETLCRKLGVQADPKGWGTFNRFEIEGGISLEKVRGRVEMPFQLEGMNGLGLAGAELHGIIGYTVLARFRIEIDFTKDKLAWTPLAFQPPPPAGMAGKNVAPPELSAIASLMKMTGRLLGRRAAPVVMPRGFLGIILEEREGKVFVQTVLDQSPAAAAGLKVNDQITKCAGKPTQTILQFHQQIAGLRAGERTDLTVIRGGLNYRVVIQAGEGL